MTHSTAAQIAAHVALYMAALGRLRLLLMILVIMVVLFAPDSSARAVIEWPLIVPTLIAPAIAPIVLMVVMLDLMMAKIMSGGEPSVEKKEQARWIMLTNLIAAVGLVYSYLPFFLALTR